MPLPRRLSEPGPVLEYLMRLRQFRQAEADELVAEIHAVLNSEKGAKLLELLDECVSYGHLPVLSDERAYVARNAQAILASDLRRIASDEYEQVFLERPGEGARGRGHTRTR